MKILAYVGAVLLSLLVMTSGIVALALTGGSSSLPLLALGVLGLTVIVYGPLTLGSLVAFWDVRRSDGARALFRRWTIVVICAETAGAIAILVDAALGGTAWGVAVAFIVAGALLTFLALAIGNAVRRHEERQPAAPAALWQPLDAASRAVKVRAVAITFAVSAVVTAIGFAVFVLLTSHPADWGRLVPTAAGFPLMATAFACILVALPLGARLRETAGGDLGRMRTFARVVLKGKVETLTPDDEVGAARYASAIGLFLRYQLAYLSLLYGGIVLVQLGSLLTGVTGRVLPLSLIGALVVTLLVLLPIQLRRVRRASRYADGHRALLTADA